MELYGTLYSLHKALQIKHLRQAIRNTPRLATFARELYKVKKELYANFVVRAPRYSLKLVSIC
jgi:hypothetical protein